MLIGILNHNLPELTDNLFNIINKGISAEDQIIVLDNGSEPSGIAQSTTHNLEKNYYFGGGVNIILKAFLSSSHSKLMIMNNDLILHGHNFIERVKEQSKDLDLYSPSVINASISQCNWKTMHNWGTGRVRLVPFIDFQCPVISRELAERIGEFPNELYLGYGLDFYASILSDRIGVDDGNVVCHLENQTIKRGKLKEMSPDHYYMNNSVNMNNYFMGSAMREEYIEMKKMAKNYQYDR